MTMNKEISKAMSMKILCSKLANFQREIFQLKEKIGNIFSESKGMLFIVETFYGTLYQTQVIPELRRVNKKSAKRANTRHFRYIRGRNSAGYNTDER